MRTPPPPADDPITAAPVSFGDEPMVLLTLPDRGHTALGLAATVLGGHPYRDGETFTGPADPGWTAVLGTATLEVFAPNGVQLYTGTWAPNRVWLDSLARPGRPAELVVLLSADSTGTRIGTWAKATVLTSARLGD